MYYTHELSSAQSSGRIICIHGILNARLVLVQEVGGAMGEGGGGAGGTTGT